MRDVGALMAGPDFYESLGSADPGLAFTPAALPATWTSHAYGVWTRWTGPASELPAQGWKVHVSATLANAQLVLDVVAAVCADLGIPFKHVAGRAFFLAMHHKHADRVQGGKFCALYPPTTDAARQVMERLEHDLAGIAGPYILTDRRFGSSECVSYRYGAFYGRFRLEADGSRTPTLLVQDGAEAVDQRRPYFVMPPGVEDPFATEKQDSLADGPAHFNGYVFDRVLQHSNAGGAYVARASDGVEIFVKEARAHTGYTDAGTDAKARLQHEFLVLQAIHSRAPGLCPAPIDYFSHWENSYLVTELVPGVTLQSWAAASSSLIQVSPSPEEVADYYRRCGTILRALDDILARLHELGFVFGDLSLRNVLVDEEDRPRLIDFESALHVGEPAVPPATPGFVPPEARDPKTRATMDPCHLDDYALDSLALALIAPLNNVADRNPAVLDHLYAELLEFAPPPAPLWEAATRSRARPPDGSMPSPEDVRSDAEKWLRWLRDATADALEAMASPDHAQRCYPTTPDGHRTNTRCLAHGTAGVLHALRAAERAADPTIVSRLRDESLREAADTPPGLLYGSAGIAWVLADLGEVAAAQELLRLATGHRLTRESPTLGGGGAGLALGHLKLYCRTRESWHLDAAHRTLSAMSGEGLDRLLDGGSGWADGASGVALALHYLTGLTGEPRHRQAGLALLRAEAARYGERMPGGALSFRVSDNDRRAVPYLRSGSAGFAHVLARYLVAEDDPELALVLGDCLSALTIRITALPGLMRGRAGMSLVLGDIADSCGRPQLLDFERVAATYLFCYAVPHETGVRWPGGDGLRLSADLATGAAGVLLALTRVLDRTPDPLFTLDRDVSVHQEPSAVPR